MGVAGQKSTARGTKAWQRDEVCPACGGYPDRAAAYRKWRIDVDWLRADSCGENGPCAQCGSVPVPFLRRIEVVR